ncbi:MAG: D-alanine--D-alanine ligase [Lachnospiraceae bacterium]|nr:D-alanine--D-alanine ligase [Lachnospiraceae bacterium]
MKIVVLAGGTSTERDVSLVSGAKIYKALKENGHKCVLLDVFLGLEDVDTDTVFDRGDELLGNIEGIKQDNPDLDAVKALRKDGGRSFFGPNVLEICSKADVVFMALHGENGENGKVQAAFDLHGIRYTGNDYVSSALAMDKALSKDLFRQYGISTPEGFALKKGEADNNTVKFPVVVKVTDGGSSIGVYIAHNEAEYEKAKKDAFTYGNELVVEQFIEGREFSCGVILGEALPVIEIAPKEGFYDYKNKYQEGSTIETCPAVLDDATTKRMQKMAVDVYNALRLNQYARIDIMMDKAGEIYALEANTLPGMTPMSLMPQEAAAVGVSYNELCEKLIKMAMDK